MKISKFIITASSAFYFAVIGDIPSAIVLGILAIMEHCKIMSALEGGEDPWESHGRKIQRCRRRS